MPPQGQQQTCKVCGRPDKFDFYLPDELWAAVVPVEYRDRVVCLYCFDEFAAAAGQEYAASLQKLYFAGIAAVFVFVPSVAINC
jgi:hypothetical protein